MAAPAAQTMRGVLANAPCSAARFDVSVFGAEEVLRLCDLEVSSW